MPLLQSGSSYRIHYSPDRWTPISPAAGAAQRAEGNAVPEQTQQRATRVRLRAPVEYRACEARATHGTHGIGTIWDISASGARLEDVSASLEQGATAWLRCSFFLGSFDVELKGSVVRHTETGFAIEFRELGKAQVGLLRSILPEGAQA